MTWFDWVLWTINQCRLFNYKSIFYTYKQSYFKQFCQKYVHSLNVKNSSI